MELKLIRYRMMDDMRPWVIAITRQQGEIMPGCGVMCFGHNSNLITESYPYRCHILRRDFVVPAYRTKCPLWDHSEPEDIRFKMAGFSTITSCCKIIYRQEHYPLPPTYDIKSVSAYYGSPALEWLISVAPEFCKQAGVTL